MATNTGRDFRIGSVKGRTQFQHENGDWQKRNEGDGQFMERKQSDGPFKASRKSLTDAIRRTRNDSAGMRSPWNAAPRP